MRADFYQLGQIPIEQVISTLSAKLLAAGERLLIVGEDEARLARLDRILWDQGAATFLPHAVAGASEEARQPVLLSTSPDAANRARNMLIADGKWRDAALAFQRAFFLFDSNSLDEARAAWRSWAANDAVECHYWANEDGRWTEKASSNRGAT